MLLFLQPFEYKPSLHEHRQAEYANGIADANNFIRFFQIPQTNSILPLQIA
jgi:hypothetical protein